MIEYLFTMDDGTIYKFDINAKKMFDKTDDNLVQPAWTMLDFYQCDNCTLSIDEYPYCPTALDVKEVIIKFNNIFSFEKVKIHVKTPERDYLKHCDVQTGLRSLLGLIMPMSACPILSLLRCMAHYHLPFSTPEETIVRTTGAYFLKQYFVFKEKGSWDLELKELRELYEQLRTVNRCFGNRICAASKKDANMNAADKLFFISEIVSFHLDEKLEELRPIFS